MKPLNYLLALGAISLAWGCSSDKKSDPYMSSKVELMTPDGINKNPAYSQIAVVDGKHKTIYIGGQNSVDEKGNIVGKGDIEAQARQVLHNVDKAVQAGGGSLQNIIKWNVYIVQGQKIDKAFKVFQEPLSKMKNPPLVTGIFVAGLAHPDFLLEIEAVAVVPMK